LISAQVFHRKNKKKRRPEPQEQNKNSVLIIPKKFAWNVWLQSRNRRTKKRLFGQRPRKREPLPGKHSQKRRYVPHTAVPLPLLPL
jgi:hypothetical protein